MSSALRTALREACAELREHMTPDWQAYTSLKQIEEWERLADEAGPAPGEPFDAWRERTLQAHRDEVAARIAAGSYTSPEQPIGDRDVKPENLPTPAQIDGHIERFVRSHHVPTLPIPGHARLCCARLGSVWCTEPHGHPPPCKGPEEREIASGEYGPGRRR